jgi:hypothetical protein
MVEQTVIAFVLLFCGVPLSADPMATQQALDTVLAGLPDHTSRVHEVQVRAGASDVDLVVAMVESSSGVETFVFKRAYRHLVGATRSGARISGGRVFVVDPRQHTGHLWWKKPLFVTIEEPHWTLFKVDGVSLPTVYLTRLGELLAAAGNAQ